MSARGWSGERIIIASLVAGVAGVGPLALYIAFGPKDGNPIGLGLLAALAVPVAGVGVCVGVIRMAVRHLPDRDAS